MIGLWSSHAGTFLVHLGLATLATLGLPMLVSPLGWGRALGWWIPAEARLAVYFGRCLASVICMLCWGAFRSAAHPAEAPLFFDLLSGCSTLMVAVHVHGALRRSQPRAETYEIAAWVGLFVAALVFRPVA